MSRENNVKLRDFSDLSVMHTPEKSHDLRPQIWLQDPHFIKNEAKIMWISSFSGVCRTCVR